jgi:Cof subfamily protein (haloacid dehalogenase superfamily)
MSIESPDARLNAPIAFVVSDIDGTLVTPDKLLTPRAVAAVERLAAAGVAFSLVSSRPPRGMLGVAAALKVCLPIAGFNGGNIVQPDGTLIAAKRLAPTAARRALALFADQGIEAWVFADGDWLVLDPHGPKVEREAHAIGFGPMVVASFDPFADRIDKIVGVSEDAPRLAAVEALAKDILGGQAAASRSQPYYLDVTHPAADKGGAVRDLCAAAGVDLANTAVIGDMANDVAMFRVAGFSVAMGQSPDAVKAEADAVTAANTDEGFARAIETLVLPRVAGR